MDIFDFAMKMEMDGKQFYEKQARVTTNPQLKKILLTLAEEEQKHFDFFKRLKEGDTDLAVEEISSRTETLDNVKNIFVEMSEETGSRVAAKDEISAWTEALRIEEKAESFYKEKAARETNEKQRKLLLLIAGEEQSHVHMISGVLTFLKYPDTFAQSAQFKNFMSLEGH
jgi:rubrerythrin